MTEDELKAYDGYAENHLEMDSPGEVVAALVAEVRRLRRVIGIMHTRREPEDEPEVREVLREIGHAVSE